LRSPEPSTSRLAAWDNALGRWSVCRRGQSIKIASDHHLDQYLKRDLWLPPKPLASFRIIASNALLQVDKPVVKLYNHLSSCISSNLICRMRSAIFRSRASRALVRCWDRALSYRRDRTQAAHGTADTNSKWRTKIEFADDCRRGLRQSL
jgi:hypothetical protein